MKRYNNYASDMSLRNELVDMKKDRTNSAMKRVADKLAEQRFIKSSKKLGSTISREGDEILASPPGTPGYKKPLLDLNPINIGKSIVKGVRTIGDALASPTKLTRNKKRVIKRY